MSRDSHGNPSQPHCVSVTWLFFFVYTDFLFVCNLSRKNLGIASADAAGLNKFTQSFSRQGKPTIRFLFLARRAFIFPFPGKESPRFSSFFRQGEPSFR